MLAAPAGFFKYQSPRRQHAPQHFKDRLGGDGVTRVATPFQERCHHRCNAVSVTRKIALEAAGRGTAGTRVSTRRPFLTATSSLSPSGKPGFLKLVALEETRFSSQPLDFVVKFLLAP